MCKDMTYIQKFCSGCFVIIVVIIIILSVYIGVNAGASASVEMTGDHDESVVQQSSGFHVLEVNGNNLGSDQFNGWCWEVSVQMKDLTNQPSNLPVVVTGLA